MKSKIRVRVEHVFGFMTNSMNDALHMTSIEIQRIESNIGFLNLTYNLFRYEQLVRYKKIKMMHISLYSSTRFTPSLPLF